MSIATLAELKRIVKLMIFIVLSFNLEFAELIVALIDI